MAKREKAMTERTFIKTFLYVWPYVLVVAGLIQLIGGRSVYTLSFFLGSAVSVMLMSHHYRSAMRTADRSLEDLKMITFRNYLFRFAFYALILFIAHLSEGLDLIFTFIGFTSFKVAMILTFLIAKGEDKDAPSETPDASSGESGQARDDSQEGEDDDG